MSRLVMLAASVFEISCGKTDRQTNKQVNIAQHPNHANAVGVGNQSLMIAKAESLDRKDAC